MLENLLAFASGVGVCVVGAFTATYFQARSEERRCLTKAKFEIYMKLMELQAQYFWVLSAEARQESPSLEVKTKIKLLAWQIADLLREADKIEHLPQILNVLFGTNFETASSRHDAIEKLLSEMGHSVNPNYATVVKQLSTASVRHFAKGSDRHSHTPGFM